MLLNLRVLRKNHQLSQVKLAGESGVSLPTIQNIEAGKANPTIEVLEKLLYTFGLEFQIVTPTFDGERAVAFGVPLISKASNIDVVVTKNTLKIEVRKWFHVLVDNKITEREVLALVAFLKGIKDHYPAFYQKEIATPFIEKLILKFSQDERVIKLRRIALKNMSHYL